jgi:AAA+ ATPase superfamily predicted ATPase
MKNPFKFGTIVDEPYFTNRTNEIKKVKSILESENHLIIIGPRRFGKSSQIQKVF